MPCYEDKVEWLPSLDVCLYHIFDVPITPQTRLSPHPYPSRPRLLDADVDIFPRVQVKGVIDGSDVETKSLPASHGYLQE